MTWLDTWFPSWMRIYFVWAAIMLMVRWLFVRLSKRKEGVK
jgi:hypothetical protein